MEETRGSAWEVFRVFLKLGLTSFGGPVAHLGFFREECVQRRGWVSDAAYADLVALCQFLPGPASSQTGFALGYLRAGLPGAFAAWAAFTLPSMVLMIACAYGIAFFSPDSAWLHGLKVAAVAVVAQAVWSMSRKLCPDFPRGAMALAATCTVLLAPSAWTQLAVIGAGLGSGAWLLRTEIAEEKSASFPLVRGGRFSTACLSLFLLLLFVLPLLAASGNRWLMLADGFYRTGSMVFGGGHAVLPLLETQTVGRGWISHDAFLSGYGAAQALPGPLMAFAAYLGALCLPGAPLWLSGTWSLLAILLPSFLLVLAALPHWQRLRNNPRAQAALAGANAAVVGLLLAALYDPVSTNAITSPGAAAMALTAFAALQFARVPPWLIVIACALGGAFLLRA
jgi:chromate transporter